MENLNFQAEQARILFDRGEWEQSRDLYSKILNQAVQESNSAIQVSALWGLAANHNRQSNYGEAITFATQGLQVCQQHNIQEENGFYLELGTTHYFQAEYEKARNYYEKALHYNRAKNDRGSEASSLLAIANIDLAMNQPDMAIQSYEKALAVYQEMGDKRQESHALMNLASAYHHSNQLQKALGYYEQALEINTLLKNTSHKATCLRGMANIYQSLGKYEKPISLLEESLSLTLEIGEHSGNAEAWRILGRIYQDICQYKKAIELLEKSLNASKSINDRSSIAKCVNTLAYGHLSNGDNDKASQYAMEGLRLKRELGDRKGEVYSLCALGNVSRNLQDYEKAIVFYEQALSISKAIDDKAGIALGTVSLGFTYKLMARYKDALASYNNALRLYEELGLIKDQADTLRWIADVHIAQNNRSEALKFYQRSLDICEKNELKLIEQSVTYAMGCCFDDAKSYKQALPSFQKSLMLAKELDLSSHIANTHYMIGRTCYNLGQITEATQHYKMAEACYTKIGNTQWASNARQKLQLL